MKQNNNNYKKLCREGNGSYFCTPDSRTILARRGARVVESGGLENRYGSNSIEGSNPSLSSMLNNSLLKHDF